MDFPILTVSWQIFFLLSRSLWVSMALTVTSFCPQSFYIVFFSFLKDPFPLIVFYYCLLHKIKSKFVLPFPAFFSCLDQIYLYDCIFLFKDCITTIIVLFIEDNFVFRYLYKQPFSFLLYPFNNLLPWRKLTHFRFRIKGILETLSPAVKTNQETIEIKATAASRKRFMT